MAYRVGHPERPPLTTPLSRGDYWGAINAAGATMAAVFARRKAGRGQHVDISSSECMANFINSLNVIDFVDVGFYPKRGGHRLGYIGYPWALLPCKDGYFALITVSDRHWERFVELMGNPEWSKDPRYRDRDAMGKLYPDEVDELVRPWVAGKTKAELWRLCREGRIPFQPVQSVADLAHCPHLNERGFFQEADHVEAGKLNYPGAPYQFSATPWALRKAAPTLGQDTHAILGGLLGMSRIDLVDLRRTGVT